MTTEQGSNQAELSLRALFVFVAVVAYTVSPVLKYADIRWTVLAAAIGGIGVQLMMLGSKSWIGMIGSLLMIGGLVFGAELIFDATQVHTENQRRCMIIQSDMLSAKPKRSDAADIFQALGCVPQPVAGEEVPRLAAT
ncbi:hypothetical protein [Sphingomonas aurantiaca]|nr:hypothetical protein [Sphingomonas aurantiaca]